MVLEYFLSMTLCYHKLHYRYRNRRVSLALLYDGIRQCLLHTPKQILCFVRPHIVQSYMPEAEIVRYFRPRGIDFAPISIGAVWKPEYQIQVPARPDRLKNEGNSCSTIPSVHPVTSTNLGHGLIFNYPANKKCPIHCELCLTGLPLVYRKERGKR